LFEEQSCKLTSGAIDETTQGCNHDVVFSQCQVSQDCVKDQPFQTWESEIISIDVFLCANRIRICDLFYKKCENESRRSFFKQFASFSALEVHRLRSMAIKKLKNLHHLKFTVLLLLPERKYFSKLILIPLFEADGYDRMMGHVIARTTHSSLLTHIDTCN